MITEEYYNNVQQKRIEISLRGPERELEFQHLSQFEGEYIDINVAPNTSLY